MDFNEFIGHIAAQFDQPGELTSETQYRDHEEWCSLLMLSVLAVIYKKYRVRLKGDEMSATHTWGELYELVQSKI